MKMGVSRKALKKMSTVLASLLAGMISVSGATASLPDSAHEEETIWQQVKQMNSLEGYSAFLRSHSDDNPFAPEARRRAINLLGQFDAVSSFDTLTERGGVRAKAEPYLISQINVGSDANLPIGKRRWTLVEVYVDENGLLVDANGNFVDLTGKPISNALQVRANGSVLTSDNATVIDDVVVDINLRPEEQTNGRVGRLSIPDDEFSRLELSVETAQRNTDATVDGGQQRAQGLRAALQAQNAPSPLGGVYGGG